MPGKTGYTDAQKAAYYKQKYMATQNGYKKGTPAYQRNKNTKAYYKYKTAKDVLKEQRRYANAKEARERGPGVLSAIGGSLGSMAGTYLGGPAGTAIGTFLGGKIGHLAEQITGFGAYKIRNNSIMRGGMTPPQVVNSFNRGGYVVRHREYLADINATTAFTVQTFALNPGVASSFPWLAQVASSFEEYRWRGLLFEFKSLSSDAVLSSATSSALGSIVMATQYNALSPAFPDKKTMENYEFACSEKPSCTFIHPVECKPGVTPVTKLYVRSGGIPANADQRLYDLGEFSIATVGMQANSGVAGELWATYEVEFFKNKYNPIELTDHLVLATVTNAAPLGLTTAAGSVQGSNLGGTINAAGTIYSFPPNLSNGLFLVTFIWVSSGPTGAVTGPTLGLANCINRPYISGGGNRQSPANGVTTAILEYIMVIQVQSQNATITLSGCTLPPSIQYADMYVTQISNTITS